MTLQEWITAHLPEIKIFSSIALSFFAGFFVGATELIATFQYRRKLFRLRAFWGYLCLYGIAGTTAFLLLSLHNKEYLQQPLLGFAVGLSFQTLIRSRFTLVRSQGEKSF